MLSHAQLTCSVRLVKSDDPVWLAVPVAAGGRVYTDTYLRPVMATTGPNHLPTIRNVLLPNQSHSQGKMSNDRVNE